MKLTGVGKAFVTLVILGVLGFAVWHYKGDAIRNWAGADKTAPRETITKDDFESLKGAPPDPDRGKGSTGVARTVLASSGKLTRTLVVGINTWAGHAPGIVFNGGMGPGSPSGYKQPYGLHGKFVLAEGPAAQLAAFRNGDAG